MAKFKIQKNLSDKDMFKGWSEEDTFEDTMLDAEKQAQKVSISAPSKRTQNDFYREFLTEKVEAQIGKMLLDIKMEYFKQGEGAFSIQVKRDGMNLIIETAPKQVK